MLGVNGEGRKERKSTCMLQCPSLQRTSWASSVGQSVGLMSRRSRVRAPCSAKRMLAAKTKNQLNLNDTRHPVFF